MRTMKRNRIRRLLALALLLGCLLLTGCALHNKTLDAQMTRVVQALNERDDSALRAMFDEKQLDDASFRSFARSLHVYWQKTDPEEIRLVQLNINKNSQQSVWSGTYVLPEGTEYNVLRLVYAEDSAGHGSLQSLYLDKAEVPSAGISIVTILWYLLCAAFIVFTIVDVARKKPIKYGWFIALSLLTFFLRKNGAQVTVPLGAVIYWCIRKSLLRQKAARDAAAAEPLPPGDSPEAPE